MSNSNYSISKNSSIPSQIESVNLPFKASPTYYKILIEYFYEKNLKINTISLIYTTLLSSSNISIRIHSDKGFVVLAPQNLSTHTFDEAIAIPQRLFASESNPQVEEFTINIPTEDCLIEVHIKSDIDILFKNIILKWQ
jgi:hypothetical protein